MQRSTSATLGIGSFAPVWGRRSRPNAAWSRTQAPQYSVQSLESRAADRLHPMWPIRPHSFSDSATPGRRTQKGRQKAEAASGTRGGSRPVDPKARWMQAAPAAFYAGPRANESAHMGRTSGLSEGAPCGTATFSVLSKARRPRAGVRPTTARPKLLARLHAATTRAGGPRYLRSAGGSISL